MTTFVLDPRIAASTLPLGALPLCEVRLAADSRWPWLLLLPRQAGIVELTDLAADDRGRLVEEATLVSAALRAVTGAEKTNVATLGNAVPQFHLHVVARRAGDPNWPGPIWGYGEAEPYGEGEAERLADALREKVRFA